MYSCVGTGSVEAEGNDVRGEVPVIQGFLHGFCFRLPSGVICAGNAKDLVVVFLNKNDRQSGHRVEALKVR